MALVRPSPPTTHDLLQNFRRSCRLPLWLCDCDWPAQAYVVQPSSPNCRGRGGLGCEGRYRCLPATQKFCVIKRVCDNGVRDKVERDRVVCDQVVCDEVVCDHVVEKMVCDREGAEEEYEEERNTESRTRTPHKDVGNKAVVRDVPSNKWR